MRPESREKVWAADLENWVPGRICYSLAQPPALTWLPLNLSLFFYKAGGKSQLIVGPFSHEAGTRQRENQC